jgi:hypothetical protein
MIDDRVYRGLESQARGRITIRGQRQSLFQPPPPLPPSPSNHQSNNSQRNLSSPLPPSTGGSWRRPVRCVCVCRVCVCVCVHVLVRSVRRSVKGRKSIHKVQKDRQTGRQPHPFPHQTTCRIDTHVHTSINQPTNLDRPTPHFSPPDGWVKGERPSQPLPDRIESNQPNSTHTIPANPKQPTPPIDPTTSTHTYLADAPWDRVEAAHIHGTRVAHTDRVCSLQRAPR